MAVRYLNDINEPIEVMEAEELAQKKGMGGPPCYVCKKEAHGHELNPLDPRDVVCGECFYTARMWTISTYYGFTADVAARLSQEQWARLDEAAGWKKGAKARKAAEYVTDKLRPNRRARGAIVKEKKQPKKKKAVIVKR